MNLVDELLEADVKKATELETGDVKSKRLAKILEKKDPVTVKIKELEPRRLNDISATQFKNNGDLDFGKTYDAKLLMCIEGCADPDLMNKDLQAHFGCKSAKELAELLFRSEAGDIADAITGLSGVVANEEKNEEEVKNS